MTMAKKKITPIAKVAGKLLAKYGPSPKPSRSMPKSPTKSGLRFVNDPDKKFRGKSVLGTDPRKQSPTVAAKRKTTDALIAKNTPKQTKATEAARAKKFASLKKKPGAMIARRSKGKNG
tara:strand:+ start:7081 stop:7437 length:357 start_codon:yes stop_codon:yes gene_type:complete